MSFNLLYSGSSVANGFQNSALESLGGYISSSNIPNNKSGNVFSAESYLGIINSEANVRCIILKALSTHTNLLIGILPQDNMTDSCDIQLGFSILGSVTSVEQIPDEQSDPDFVEFNDIMYMENLGDQSHMFDVAANIEAGNCVAIWIKRKLKNNYNGNQELIDQIAADAADDSQDPILTGFQMVMDVDGIIPPNPIFVSDDRIQFTCSDEGQTTFQDNALINKEVSYMLRENQYEYVGIDYTFDNVTGTVTFTSPLGIGERIVIFYQ